MLNKLLLSISYICIISKFTVNASEFIDQANNGIIHAINVSSNLPSLQVSVKNIFLQTLLQVTVSEHLGHYIKYESYQNPKNNEDLATILKKNQNILKNTQSVEALRRFQELTDYGYVPAMNEIASQCFKFEQYEQAISWYVQALETE